MVISLDGQVLYAAYVILFYLIAAPIFGRIRFLQGQGRLYRSSQITHAQSAIVLC
jgi:hypothetical protein